MSTCDHCERAKAGIGAGYGYRMHPAPCTGCVSRSVARSMVTFEAVRSRDITDLRATLERVLPAIPFEESSDMVRAWWQLDHAQPRALPNTKRPK